MPNSTSIHQINPPPTTKDAHLPRASERVGERTQPTKTSRVLLATRSLGSGGSRKHGQTNTGGVPQQTHCRTSRGGQDVQRSPKKLLVARHEKICPRIHSRMRHLSG